MLVVVDTIIALLRPYLSFAAESERVRFFQNETRKLFDNPVKRGAGIKFQAEPTNRADGRCRVLNNVKTSNIPHNRS